MRWSPARSVRVGRAAGAHPTVRRAGTPDRLRGAGADAAGPAERYARRRGRRNPATSPPEGLLRLVTHHLGRPRRCVGDDHLDVVDRTALQELSLIHISEPTRRTP